MKQARAIAHSNIALVKYWGKRSGQAGARLNLPAVGSVSVTLEALSTDTTVLFDESLPADQLELDGQPATPAVLQRVSQFLDLVRSRAGLQWHARVQTRNDFPTGAGLASSASAFAALARASVSAAGLVLDDASLASLARRGSGSAARSIFGGFAAIDPGKREDGEDCRAYQLAAPDHWPLRVIVAITDEGPKSIGSTQGMVHCAETSPYFDAWLHSHPMDMDAASVAIAERDFPHLAAVSEHSCLKMHAVMMASKPGLVYWNPGTLAAIATVRTLQSQGVPVFFTIDAGPHVKAVCEAPAADAVESALRASAGVCRIVSSGLGLGARLP